MVQQELEGVKGNVQESHQPRHKAFTSPIEDVQESSKERRSQDKSNQPAFKDISDKNDGRGLVESVFLLKDEGPVHFQRMHWEG